MGGVGDDVGVGGVEHGDLRLDFVENDRVLAADDLGDPGNGEGVLRSCSVRADSMACNAVVSWRPLSVRWYRWRWGSLRIMP